VFESKVYDVHFPHFVLLVVCQFWARNVSEIYSSSIFSRKNESDSGHCRSQLRVPRGYTSSDADSTKSSMQSFRRYIGDSEFVRFHNSGSFSLIFRA